MTISPGKKQNDKRTQEMVVGGKCLGARHQNRAIQCVTVKTKHPQMMSVTVALSPGAILH